MKKILPLILALTFILVFVACSKENDTASEPNTVHTESVNSTQTPISDTTEESSNNTESLKTESANSTVSNEISLTSKTTVSSTPIESNPTETSKPVEVSQHTENTVPVHTHTFASATCTEPKKCSCGVTEGEALGHSWQEATCTAPKTCSVCKTVEGGALGHNYKADTYTDVGKCSRCGKTEVSDSDFAITKPNSIHDWFEDKVNEQVYVTETINVYSAPGTEYDVIGTLNKGDVITRTSIGNLVGWNQVEYGGERGYVKSSCLSTKSPFFIAAEAHGFNVGDVTTLTNEEGGSYTLKYLGEDKWEDQNGTIWTSHERDDGTLHFTSISFG